MAGQADPAFSITFLLSASGMTRLPASLSVVAISRQNFSAKENGQ
jgi:hypothetical protein